MPLFSTMPSAEKAPTFVVGATGTVGRRLTRQLADECRPVRAATRHPDRYDCPAAAEPVRFDMTDPSTHASALEGAESVFLMAPSDTDAYGQLVPFIDAAAAAGVERVALMTAMGVDQAPDEMPLRAAELHLRKSDLAATILRPVYFMENWSQFTGDAIREGQLPQPLSPDTALQQIATGDIGAFAALAFANPDDWIGRAVELAGDELTMTETGEAFSRVLSRDVEHVQVPWDVFEEQSGEEMTVMYRWFEDVGYDADIEALRETPPGLQRLEPFLREHGWDTTIA